VIAESPVDPEIRPLKELHAGDLARVATGYTATEKYLAIKKENDEQTMISLVRVILKQPFTKRFTWDAATLAGYEHIAAQGVSFGAYVGDELVGIALAEVHSWNRTLWVHELHVAEAYQRQGLGRRLIERLARAARERELRALVCETQSTNVPAIDFYHRVGLRIDGIDLSYYTNHDATDCGEVAVFMKLKL
jgi:ribosomal protein S18 acetylase RimI-like enzyme